jgi:putative ABC transport system substrate-binding protein
MTIPGGRAVAATVITLSLVVAISILAAPVATDAQAAGAIHRIGFLGAGSRPPVTWHLFEAFRQGLRELGWVEGQNIVIEYRFAEGRFERVPDLAAELVQLKADVIVVGSTPPALAAKNATGTIPIVMVAIGDPVRQGLVASLARPGGNITGLSLTAGFETVSKGLELLKETVPKLRRAALLSNPANPSHALVIREMKGAARSLGVQLQLVEARDLNEFDGAFTAMAKERAGALFVVLDPLFILHRARLAGLAAKNRLPSMYWSRENVEAGGLMSYGPSLPDLYRRAATFVDRIFKGAKPADLPVEQPTKFELVINLKSAKALGLTIPQSILVRADQVIE